MTEQTVGVSIADDWWTEPAETVLGRLTDASNAMIAGTGESPLTISANDGTRVTIDPAYPGLCFADLHAREGVYSQLEVANAEPTATTVRLTHVRPDGSGQMREFPVAANTRISFWWWLELGLTGPFSLAMQALNASAPLQAEHLQFQPGAAERRRARSRPRRGISLRATSAPLRST